MRTSFALLPLLLFMTSVRGESPSWPQFRGPGASGIAEDEKPPVEIGPDKNVKWKVAAPAGLSSPIIVGERLIITAFDGGKLYTIAYNRADGSEIWRAEAPAKQLEPYHKTEGSPAASTPATDGERIVSYFGSCGLFCYDLAGNELWKYEMPPAATPGDFGTGVSPVIAEGTVILVRDEMNDPKIIAVDLTTGQPKWEKKRESKSGYATPAVWKTSAGTQIAVPGLGRMIGYDVASGDEKWYVEGMPSAACASPVTANGELFFAGWSPGDPTEADSFKMPTFDELIAQTGDDNKDGLVSKEEASDSFLKDFFSNQDINKDGQITRQEWDAILQFMAASRNSAFALKPGGAGDITESHVRWKKKKGLPYVPTAILYRGQYVMVKDGGIVTAYDAETGEEIYQRRAIASGNYYASPVAANGNIYFTSLADGVVTVLKGGADKPETLAENPPLGERVAATPAIADDTLYVRTAGHLYAFAEN
ncbi:MAG TPA: PQQ-binding-like beta-propeller repeat protein [Lacipirellulaceae bacterium]|nr:PQQ-binding-like beta-propeller repeat protein [Lacipirellulaceae bacterium]